MKSAFCKFGRLHLCLLTVTTVQTFFRNLFIGFIREKKKKIIPYLGKNVSIFCIYVLLICKYLDIFKLLCS